MELAEVLEELKGYGNDRTQKIYRSHGAGCELFGVQVGDMKKILKKTKKDHPLALQLFDTGNGDAMYLGALMADQKKITAEDLNRWAEKSTWHMVSEYGVAGLAAESPFGWELGLAWIDSDKELVAATGWATLGGVLSLLPDEELDLVKIESLLERVKDKIHDAPNRVRSTMNHFVISVGSYLAPLWDKALAVGRAVGKVSVELGGTACKVPFAPDYLARMRDKGRVGKKRKYVRC